MPEEIPERFIKFQEEFHSLCEKYSVKHYTLSVTTGHEGIHIGGGDIRVQASLLKESVEILVQLQPKELVDDPEPVLPNEPNTEGTLKEETHPPVTGPTSQCEN